MTKTRLLTILLIVLVTVIIFSVTRKRDIALVNPASPTPSSSAYNPPKEIKYDNAADLMQELEGINPEVLESDFE